MLKCIVKQLIQVFLIKFLIKFLKNRTENSISSIYIVPLCSVWQTYCLIILIVHEEKSDQRHIEVAKISKQLDYSFYFQQGFIY